MTSLVLRGADEIQRPASLATLSYHMALIAKAAILAVIAGPCRSVWAGLTLPLTPCTSQNRALAIQCCQYEHTSINHILPLTATWIVLYVSIHVFTSAAPSGVLLLY